MTVYRVAARRWAKGWELHVEGVGVTQSHMLGDAEMMVRDLIAINTGEPPDSFGVQITPEPGGQDPPRSRLARLLAPWWG